MQYICENSTELNVVQEFEDKKINCDVCITEQMTNVFRDVSPLASN